MTREQIIRELAAEGLVIVPAEPTVWGPRAGAMHPHEPGLVSAIREAIRAGALKP